MELDPKWVGVVFSFLSMVWWAATQFSNTKKDIEALQDNMCRIEGALKDILRELKLEAGVNASLKQDIIRLQEQIKSHQATLMRSQGVSRDA